LTRLVRQDGRRSQDGRGRRPGDERTAPEVHGVWSTQDGIHVPRRWWRPRLETARLARL
jgi:hypothetical protein